MKFSLPEVTGVLTADEIRVTGDHLAALQLPSGMIPWYRGGHCDPWNHVESAMALDVVGRHDEAAWAYDWLATTQRPDGCWHNYYRSDGSIEERKLDTNVCAYVATGVWHHFRCTSDRRFLDELWPTVERALDWVLRHRRHDRTILWAVEPNERPWDYALLTGTCSIQHALRCGASVGLAAGVERPDWVAAADELTSVIADRPNAFEPKDRWAMDWYYPVLTGALVGEAAKARLADGWETFAMEGLGVRCVNDEPWVTASETAECAIAFAAIGDFATATDLLRWTRAHRLDDHSSHADSLDAGAYWTGIVYPAADLFPGDEHTSYTAAAVILAADAISGASPAADLFVPRSTLA
jgi:hypothetical protein